jgi:hypothetical protein
MTGYFIVGVEWEVNCNFISSVKACVPQDIAFDEDRPLMYHNLLNLFVHKSVILFLSFAFCLAFTLIFHVNCL